MHRTFLYVRFERSEDLADQDRSVALFESIEDTKVRDGVRGHARSHRDIIRRVAVGARLRHDGRVPHRVLGRVPTPEGSRSASPPALPFEIVPTSGGAYLFVVVAMGSAAALINPRDAYGPWGQGTRVRPQKTREILTDLV